MRGGTTGKLLRAATAALALVLVAGSQTAARAAEATLADGSAVTIPAPRDHCAVDPEASEADRRLAETMAWAAMGADRLLADFVSCSALEKARAGAGRLDAPATVIVLQPLRDGQPTRSPTDKAVPDFTRELAGYLDRRFETPVIKADSPARARLEQVYGDAPVTPPEDMLAPLGVLAVDDRAVYTAVLIAMEELPEDPMSDAPGTPYTVAGVTGMTFVEGQLVTLNHYRRFDEPSTLEDLLSRAKDHVAALAEANG